MPAPALTFARPGSRLPDQVQFDRPACCILPRHIEGGTVRQRHRVPLPRVFLGLVVLGFLSSTPALPSGFQVMTQAARPTGMGLAFTGVADDASAIFYNPAGMAFQDHFSLMLGGELLGR